MIREITNPNWCNKHVLTFLDDGYNCINDNFVQMDLAPYFDDKENEHVSIIFSDNFMDKTGDYLPLDFDKDNLVSLINFLNAQLEHFS